MYDTIQYKNDKMKQEVNSRDGVIIIIIISGFGIEGAAVVRDSGVGNTWQRQASQELSGNFTLSRKWSPCI